jgi:hypothetical protein
MTDTTQRPVPKIPSPLVHKSKGGFIRAVILAILALAPTAAYLETTKVDRYLVKLEKSKSRYGHWRRRRVIRWLSSCGDDPRITEAFKNELIVVSENKIYDSEYEVDSALAVLTPHLLRNQPEPALIYFEALLRIYSRYEKQQCLDIIKAYGPKLHGKLKQASRSIKDPKLRYGALLLLCSLGVGTVEDVPAILKGVEAESPPPSEGALIAQATRLISISAISQSFKPSNRHKAAKKALLAFGSDAVPYLVKGFESRSRGVANLCARVLKTVDRPTLVKLIEKKIDAYNFKGYFLPRANQVIKQDVYFKKNLREKVKRMKAKAYIPSKKDVTAAKKTIGEALHLSYLVAEGLQAFVDVRGDQKVDLCFMRALSSHNEAVAKFCAAELKRRLKRDQFVDTLFKFLVQKTEFAMKEIDVYESALKTYGQAASPDICRNMETLLKRARDNPYKVYWIHKAIALRCLDSVGQPSAYPIIKKFSRDPGSYVFVTKKRDPLGAIKEVQTAVSYRELCLKALASIEKRSGKIAPQPLKADPKPKRRIPAAKKKAPPINKKAPPAKEKSAPEKKGGGQ